jgi:hypothetical protein
MGSKRQVFHAEELTFTEAINRVPFTVLLPTKLPWPEDESFAEHQGARDDDVPVHEPCQSYQSRNSGWSSVVMNG